MSRLNFPANVEVTIAFPTCKRWLFFVTPELLSRVGDAVNGSNAKLHLGEVHMVVVSELTPEVDRHRNTWAVPGR